MAIVDYKGYRLIAKTYLPINNTNTLVYGCDFESLKKGEINIITKSKEMNQKIEETSKKLNLKPNLYQSKGLEQSLYPPFDLEGHISNTDNRMYLVNYKYLMPPVNPAFKKKNFLFKQREYCLFRSEFVKNYKVIFLFYLNHFYFYFILI